MNETAESLGKAEAFLREGNLAEAERCYRDVLASQPGQFDAVHGLAILHAQSGRVQEALPLVEQALQIAPQSMQAKATYANVLHALDRSADALPIWN